MVRVAINGYGRIGRVAHRVILERFSQDLDVVAINAGSSTDIKGWMYLLKYDSSYGPLKNHDIKSEAPSTKSETSSNDQNSNEKNNDGFIGKLIIDGKEIPVFSQKEPSLLPWKDLQVDVVIESSGHITGLHHNDKVGLENHIKAGATAVVVSAPVSDPDVGTYVLSVNQDLFVNQTIISNASCTTNCIAPVSKVILEHLGVEKAMMTTIHAYTSDQRLQDGGHKDYRRARAAGENIIPTSTGATKAATLALPQLKDKFNGLAIRVPVSTGSLSDITYLVSKNTTVEEVNDLFRKEAQNPNYKNILEVTEDPIVSSDIIGNLHSAVVDLSLTQVVGGTMVKVVAWYDNEYGYANRLIEEVMMVGKASDGR